MNYGDLREEKRAIGTSGANYPAETTENCIHLYLIVNLKNIKNGH
jgi:hypothetical protein